jgi:predicted Zn-dependent protease
VALQGNMSLADYVRSGWVSGLDPASVQETTIQGLPAAIARARAQGWDFDIAVVKVGTRVFRLLTAAPTGSPALTGVARTVSDSFHVLSNAEKAALKPLRIRIVTVRPSDTIASLAASMIGVGRKADLFRVLNELGPGATLSAGDKVKIVTDR